MANEEVKDVKGTENENEQTRRPEGYSKNPLKRAWIGVKKFPEKHPVLCKWTKRIAIGAGAAAAVYGGYKIGESVGEKRGSIPETIDTCLPEADDLPELPMNDELVPIEELAETVSNVVEETVEA